MATTIATISLSSSDLLSSALAFTSANSLNTAGSATGLTLTSGLARTTTSYASSGVIQSTTLYRSDDATADGANKIYLKNLSTTASEYYTVYIDEEEMGRLYASDWAFFPWSATSDIAGQIDNSHYPNWTTTISGAVVTFTARHAMDTGTVVTVTADVVVATAGNGTADVSSAAMGTATESDIMIIPSVHTSMTLEHMLFNE